MRLMLNRLIIGDTHGIRGLLVQPLSRILEILPGVDVDHRSSRLTTSTMVIVTVLKMMLSIVSHFPHTRVTNTRTFTEPAWSAAVNPKVRSTQVQLRFDLQVQYKRVPGHYICSLL